MQQPNNYNIPNFKRTISAFGFAHNPYRSVSTIYQNKLNEIKHALSVITPYDEDWRSIWLIVPRGTIDDYGSFEDAQYYDDIKTYDDFKKAWLDTYPNEEEWFKLRFVERDNGFMGIVLNDKILYEYNPNGRNDSLSWESEEYQLPFLDALLYGINKSLALLTAGEYNQYVKDKLPYYQKIGTILRKCFWKAFPESKQEEFEGISEADCLSFIDSMKDVEKHAVPSSRLKEMTLFQFLKCCSLGYDANGSASSYLSYEEQYKRNADGRDDGLLSIDPHSPDAFEEWQNNRAMRGGHPWEVMSGGNSTHVDLYVYHDEKGYYFMLGGDHRRKEVALFYLALHREKIPVGVRNARFIADAFAGTDKIGIVPHSVIPKYCSSMFPNENIIDFVNIYDDEIDLIKNYVEWQDIPETTLLEKD